jgi:hypothetical protein
MTNASEWRPRVGERVAIYGTVLNDDKSDTMPFQVATVPGGKDYGWYRLEELHPLPAAAEPRAPWEVLREAADVWEKSVTRGDGFAVAGVLRQKATNLEAAAAPKPPPSLAEAVRAYRDAIRAGGHTQEAYTAMIEALARAKAEEGR